MILKENLKYLNILKMLLVKTPKCPHLGCHLIYDKKEKIWTCPCHGSKFSQDGQVIISPSNKNIN